MTDVQLRVYLDKEAEESKEAISLESLDQVVNKELVIDMSNRYARSRMQTLFVDYHSILNRHGVSWILTENQKVAVSHVLSSIRSKSLQERLESDLSFSYHSLKKDFREFLKHAVKLSEAFQLVDAGPRNRKRAGGDPNSDRSGGGGGKGGGGSGKSTGNPNGGSSGNRNGSESGKKKRQYPICLWPEHKAKGIRHLMRDCPDCPKDEKRRLLAELAAEKAETPPSSGTRSQTAGGSAGQNTGILGNKGGVQPKTGRLFNCKDGSGCNITLSDTNVEISCNGRTDDGSDDTIISPRIAEAAALQGTGRMTKISPLIIQVAIREGAEATKFTFSRSWKVPRLSMHLPAGQLALLNVSFLVADADLAGEDLLIRRPILAHLGIDSQTLLYNNRSTLNGTNCDSVGNLRAGTGTVWRLMIARLQQIAGPIPSSPLENQTWQKHPKIDRGRTITRIEMTLISVLTLLLSI